MASSESENNPVEDENPVEDTGTPPRFEDFEF
jgi:hypothetical protein